MTTQKIDQDTSASKPQFRTHIPEPRWQQIASVIIVSLIVIGWLLLAFR